MNGLAAKPLAVAVAILVLVTAGTAWAAFQGLPSTGDQVNNDTAAGIDPNNPVNTADPTNADVVGGALTAGGKAVPWAIFRQLETTAGESDQVFVRSFAEGTWSTRGIGTVGGLSSDAPIFSGSLNFDQGVDGEAPAIDFAGAGRTVPWATWYESTAAFLDKNNIFASRFDVNQDKWIFAGQLRNGTPSLNIDTSQDAKNPSVAGGSAVDPTKPGPWVTWQETGAGVPGTGFNQIFVDRPIGPDATSCAGVKPAADDPSLAPAGGFCWQQVGIERVGTEPSLNVDRTRDGIEPDIAFTGTNDSVPWVVWYEQHASGDGLHNNEMVFAAKGVPATGVDGGFNWIAVGGAGQGLLDNSASGGPCGADVAAEEGCSLNADPNAPAVDPRVAAGTMTSGNPTVPWVAWEEASGGRERIFVSRLVNGQFELANGGEPLPTLTDGGAFRPDIAFSGNTPYVSWREGGNTIVGHFSTPDAFVIDDDRGAGSNVADTVRAPISSACIATPFNGDGSACQGNALGTPFFLFTDQLASGGSPANGRLFANAYRPDDPVTGSATATTTSAAVNGSINPQGSPVNVAFEFGRTTDYGQTTPTQKVPAGNSTVSFTGSLPNLSRSTTYHYRAIASSDFGDFTGEDQVVRTPAVPLPADTTPPSLSLKPGKSTLKKLLKSRKLVVKVTVNEAGAVPLTVSTKLKRRHKKAKTVTLGKAMAIFRSAGTQEVTIALTLNGRKTLKPLRKATITVKGQATDLAGNKSRAKSVSATFRRR